jgi:gliding motility-associated-like protein
MVITVVKPNAQILTPDTTICRAVPFQIRVDTTIPSTYVWSPATDLSNPGVPDPFVTTDSMRKYYLTTTTNAAGCVAEDSVVINVAGSGSIQFSRPDSAFCIGAGTTMTASGDIGTGGVIWSFGTGDSVVGNPVFYSWSEPGTYTVSVTSLYLGCPDTVRQRVVNVFGIPQLDLGNDTSICPGSDRIMLYDHAQVGTSGASWLWSTGETNSSVFVGLPGMYWATVSNHGCEVTDSVWVSNDCYLDIPNVFTPNGDGINDFFFPRQLLSKGLTSFRMNIFNRWGELIFQTAVLDGRGWDGCLNGIPQPEGVFVYTIDAQFIDNERVHRQGNVTLLR